MATIKAFTNLQQSRKLAEILPLESADMKILSFGIDIKRRVVPIDDIAVLNREDEIPCWSLAALLSVLPSVIKRKGKKMFLTLEKAGAYNLYYKSPNRLGELWETKYDVIDACYAMIIDLHEFKIL